MLLEEARSTYDIMEDRASELLEHRKVLWASESAESLRDEIRRIAGVRALDDLLFPEVREIETLDGDGCLVRKLIITPEEDIRLPALLFETPESQDGPVALYLNEEGKDTGWGPGGDIEMRLASGRRVLAVDVRGIGETRQVSQRDMGKAFGYDWRDVYTAYLLGKSYVGMRAEDVLSCVKYAGTLSDDKVDILAVGNVGVPVLHAAALEPEAFGSVALRRCLISWSDVIQKRKTYNQLVSAVHGALEVYDLPDLVRLLGEKVTVEHPLDAWGFEATGAGAGNASMSNDPELPGLAGMWYGSLDLVDPRDSDPVTVLDLAWQDPSERGRGWSAEWFGTLVGPVDGIIRFRVDASHAGWVKIDDRELLDWKDGDTGLTAAIRMEEGRAYPIHILYDHDGGDTGHFRLYWRWEEQSERVVSQAYLRHSSEEHHRMRSVW